MLAYRCHIQKLKTTCLYSDITALPTQQAGILSPIYCGAVGPELLMRANLNEHPACYLCLHQAVSGFTLSKHYVRTGPIHYGAQQEQFGNTSINIKLPCPCVDK